MSSSDQMSQPTAPATLGTLPAGSQIDPVIAQGESEVALLDKDIDRLQDDIHRMLATLDEMQQRRCDIIDKIDAHKALTAPIRILPPELLGVIFVACLPAHPGPWRSQAPLLVCRICSLWRRVALSTPELWSSLDIFHCEWRPKAEILSEWLKRSGTCPLSIDIRLVKERDVEAMASLIPYSQRWRHLELSMTNIYTFLRAQVGPLVSLQSLTLGPLGYEKNISQLYPLLESAPQLRSIDWRCESDIRILDLPWTQLTRLHNHCRLSLIEWAAILALCPQVVDVYMGGITPRHPSPVVYWRISPILLSQLQTFCVSVVFDIGLLFNILQMPVLRNLELHGPDGHMEWWETSAIPLSLLNIGHTLKKLCLGNANFAEADLVEMMTMMPSVNEISLLVQRSPAMITDQTMAALTVQPSNEEASCLLPKLEIIRLNGRLDFTTEAFVTMIASRWRSEGGYDSGLVSDAKHPVARLLVVDVGFEESIDENAAAVLKEYRDAGLVFPQWLDMVEGPSFHIDNLG